MNEIRYVRGDATRPVGDGPKAIVHVCNNVGGWGAGFVLAVSRRWEQPEEAYREQAKSGLSLGEIQVVRVEPELFVINMISQAGYGTTRVKHMDDPDYKEDFLPPIRYWALEACLRKAGEYCFINGMSVHMPRIGCALAGGSWAKVSAIVEKQLVERGVPVTVYDYPGSSFNP